MRVYWIDVPYVSSGLKRTYQKRLEVHSGIQEGNDIKTDTLHKILRGKWVEKPSTESAPYLHGYQGQQRSVPHVIMPALEEMRKTSSTYATLEMAQAAKMILLQDMTKKYELALDRLRELLRKNVPNIEAPLAVLKADYPEYFI